MRDWGLPPNEKQGRFLIETYSKQQSQKLAHLNDCLTQLAQVKHLAQDPKEIAMALWFQCSPNKLKNFLKQNAVKQNKHKSVATLLNKTKNKTIATDQALYHDITMAFYGASADVFTANELTKKRQKNCLLKAAFDYQRKIYLKSLIQRPYIYETGFFRDHYEHQARENISDALLRF